MAFFAGHNVRLESPILPHNRAFLFTHADAKVSALQKRIVGYETELRYVENPERRKALETFIKETNDRLRTIMDGHMSGLDPISPHLLTFFFLDLIPFLSFCSSFRLQSHLQLRELCPKSSSTFPLHESGRMIK